MTHRSTPDFDRMATAAREARERQEVERQTVLTAELELVAGEAFNEFHDLFESMDLDHETKMARFRAALSVMRGETPVAVTAPASPAASESIDPQARSVIERDQQRSAEGDAPDSDVADRAASAPKAEAPAKKAPAPAPEKEPEPESEEVVPDAQPKKLSLKERVGRAWNGLD